jgi:AAA+ ATPase superfamily predicted ATPase
MKARDYFPHGKAYGRAFCNRTTETEWLSGNIRAGKHSLLVAPRRFGKSSLAEQAVKKTELPVTQLNFNTCSDEYDIEVLLRQGVSNLIGKVVGSIEKIVNSIKSYVSNLTPKIVLGQDSLHLELNPKQKKPPALNVEEVLSLMDKILAEKNQHAIMLFDEFQTVGLIAKGHGVEAAIRNIAQNMTHLVIIFSGSNRSLLKSMFENEARPLYKLCRKLYLKRIAEQHYQKHINKAAKLAWNEKLSDLVFTKIMLLSERHPYYVNYLCDTIWSECKTLPKITNVEKAWNIVIEEEKSDANAEIARLSLGQRKVLKYIANNPNDNLMSSEVVRSIGLALSSIAGAIAALSEKDIIEKQNRGYSIINPIITFLLKRDGLVD